MTEMTEMIQVNRGRVRLWVALVAIAALSFTASGCGDDNGSTSAQTSDTSGADATTSGSDDATTSGSDDATTSGSDDATTTADATDTADTSGGGPPALSPPKPYSAGTCPEMRNGVTDISAPSRQVLLYVPDQPAGAPVLFLYHGAGDNADSFANNFGARVISQTFGAVVVVPRASGDFSIEWPILKDDDPAAELTLFDDVISCLEQSHDIDEARVYSAGFSAGALWTTRLLSQRADHLAAATTFSGGINERLGLFKFDDPAWPLPVMCTHGGPTDEVLVNFKIATEKLIARLTSLGSLTVLCIHDQGHTVTEDHYNAALNFLFAHTFGEPSPFAGGLGREWPSSCTLTPKP